MVFLVGEVRGWNLISRSLDTYWSLSVVRLQQWSLGFVAIYLKQFGFVYVYMYVYNPVLASSKSMTLAIQWNLLCFQTFHLSWHCKKIWTLVIEEHEIRWIERLQTEGTPTQWALLRPFQSGLQRLVLEMWAQTVHLGWHPGSAKRDNSYSKSSPKLPRRDLFDSNTLLR